MEDRDMHTLAGLMKNELVQNLQEAIIEHKGQLKELNGIKDSRIIDISDISNN